MAELSRSQIVVYAAIAVALLILGARWIRASEASPPEDGGFEAAPAADAGPSGAPAGGLDQGSVVVHVAGGVRDPGIYRMPSGSRVADAVERAGGATDSRATQAINLAALVADGQQVVVPELDPGGAPVASAGAAAEDGPISLGSASVEDLDTIEGIGPVTAEAIIAYRDENGGLSSVDELDEVSGIGPTTMDALRERLQP
ncbi:ComEA family DNA-binding protein [Thermoleophilia bacterium SCSIO 60948]|nr:ComEA family DNA-binding protein [Thermoleophilia bacterium SCSIO 60948]